MRMNYYNQTKSKKHKMNPLVMAKGRSTSIEVLSRLLSFNESNLMFNRVDLLDRNQNSVLMLSYLSLTSILQLTTNNSN